MSGRRAGRKSFRKVGSKKIFQDFDFNEEREKTIKVFENIGEGIASNSEADSLTKTDEEQCKKTENYKTSEENTSTMSGIKKASPKSKMASIFNVSDYLQTTSSRNAIKQSTSTEECLKFINSLDSPPLPCSRHSGEGRQPLSLRDLEFALEKLDLPPKREITSTSASSLFPPVLKDMSNSDVNNFFAGLDAASTSSFVHPVAPITNLSKLEGQDKYSEASCFKVPQQSSSSKTSTKTSSTPEGESTEELPFYCSVLLAYMIAKNYTLKESLKETVNAYEINILDEKNIYNFALKMDNEALKRLVTKLYPTVSCIKRHMGGSPYVDYSYVVNFLTDFRELCESINWASCVDYDLDVGDL